MCAQSSISSCCSWQSNDFVLRQVLVVVRMRTISGASFSLQKTLVQNRPWSSVEILFAPAGSAAHKVALFNCGESLLPVFSSLDAKIIPLTTVLLDVLDLSSKLPMAVVGSVCVFVVSAIPWFCFGFANSSLSSVRLLQLVVRHARTLSITGVCCG